MKKILLLLFILPFVGCSSDDEEYISNSEIEGVWVRDISNMLDYYVFQDEASTFTIDGFTNTLNGSIYKFGKYKATKDKIIFDKGGSMSYYFKNDSLFLMTSKPSYTGFKRTTYPL